MADLNVAVALTADDRASRQVQQLNQSLASLNQTGTRAHGTFGQLAGMFSAGLGIGTAATAISTLQGALTGAISASVGMNASLETATLQFQTFFGSAATAESHVRSLFDFAARTPFETREVITASRSLQTMGGSALNTEGNLRLVGDAAAATSSRFEEVAFWVGRAYNSIQAGRPFGEAALRLQELGVLSGNARNEIERLQEQGGRSSEIWAALTSDLGRLSGSMERQSVTFEGLSSTFRDNLNLLAAIGGKPIFDTAKESLAAWNAELAKPETQQAAQNFAAQLDISRQNLSNNTAAILANLQAAREWARGVQQAGVGMGIPQLGEDVIVSQQPARNRLVELGGEFGTGLEIQRLQNEALSEQAARASDAEDKVQELGNAYGFTTEQLAQYTKGFEDAAKRIAASTPIISTQTRITEQFRNALASAALEDRQALVDALRQQNAQAADVALAQVVGDPLQRSEDSIRAAQEGIREQHRAAQEAAREQERIQKEAAREQERLQEEAARRQQQLQEAIARENIRLQEQSIREADQAARQAIQDRLQLELRGIEQAADAEARRHAARLQQLDEERDRQLATISDRLRAMDREDQVRQRARQDADAARGMQEGQRTLLELQRDLLQAQASRGGGNVGAIRERMGEQQERMREMRQDEAERLRDRAREDERASLREQQDEIRRAAALGRDQEQQRAEAIREGFETERERAQQAARDRDRFLEAQQREAAQLRERQRFLEEHGLTPQSAAAFAVTATAAQAPAAVGAGTVSTPRTAAGLPPITIQITGPITVGSAADLEALKVTMSEAVSDAVRTALLEEGKAA